MNYENWHILVNGRIWSRTTPPDEYNKYIVMGCMAHHTSEITTIIPDVLNVLDDKSEYSRVPPPGFKRVIINIHPENDVYVQLFVTMSLSRKYAQIDGYVDTNIIIMSSMCIKIHDDIEFPMGFVIGCEPTIDPRKKCVICKIDREKSLISVGYCVICNPMCDVDETTEITHWCSCNSNGVHIGMCTDCMNSKELIAIHGN